MKKLNVSQMENLQGNGTKHCTLAAAGLGVSAVALPFLAGTAAVFALGCALYDL